MNVNVVGGSLGPDCQRARSERRMRGGRMFYDDSDEKHDC